MSRTDVHTPVKYVFADPWATWRIYRLALKHFPRRAGDDIRDRSPVPSRASRKRESLREIRSQLED